MYMKNSLTATLKDIDRVTLILCENYYYVVKNLIFNTQLYMNLGCFDNSFTCKNFLALIYLSTTYTKYVSVLRFSHKRVQ